MNGAMPTPKPPKQVSIFLISIFIGFFIILLLSGLNYFNIISLSNLFPNQLGWLPHKTLPSPAQTTQQNQNYTPNVFQYDTQKANKLLTDFIKDTIKPEFLPDNLDIKQGLTIDNKLEEKIKYQFGSFFNNKNTSLSINFHFKENTNTPNDFMVFIQPEGINQTIMTAEQANSLVSTYFKNPFIPISNCKTKEITSSCEEFKTESEGKKGFGAVLLKDKSNPTGEPMAFIFACFIPKESNQYETLNSCILP